MEVVWVFLTLNSPQYISARIHIGGGGEGSEFIEIRKLFISLWNYNNEFGLLWKGGRQIIFHL